MPLDWNSTTSNNTFELAVVRLPAKVPVTDPRYGGPILINPGGPGDSGTAQALSVGPYMQIIADAAYSLGSDEYVTNDSSAKYFDIMGFDPRATGMSTPALYCNLSDDEIAQYAFQQQTRLLDWPGGNLDQTWSINTMVAEKCYYDPVKNPNGPKIAQFAQTTMVVRDIVQLVEKHGEWRQAQVNASASEEVKNRVRYREGEELISFWGMSYGTVLGATMAAMQPHRAHRVVLDGVAEAGQYFNGNLTSDLDSADAETRLFFRYCAEAGPDHCDFWAGNSSSHTEKRFRALLDYLEVHKQFVVANNDISSPLPEIVTISDIKLLLVSSLYRPVSGFPALATALARLVSPNGTVLASSPMQSIGSNYTDVTGGYNSSDILQFVSVFNRTLATTVIQGADTGLRINKDQFRDIIWHSLQNVTFYTADTWATGYSGIYSFNTPAKWRFGDTHEIASNVTKNPVLFASNIIDGVTSLKSARSMQEKFAHSGLLISDGEGHSTSSMPSLCTNKKFREYFQTGKLPDISRDCLPNTRPFLLEDSMNIEKIIPTELSYEDQILYNATIAFAAL